MSEYQKWHKKALSKGWKVPVNQVFPESTWIAYWKQCAEYERNPDSGRPVIPHRSA